VHDSISSRNMQTLLKVGYSVVAKTPDISLYAAITVSFLYDVNMPKYMIIQCAVRYKSCKV
jgi:hypothetical protein